MQQDLRRYPEPFPAGLFVQEPRSVHITPAELQLVEWGLRQSLFAGDLRTTEGQRLIILDVGRLNDGPGPDILDAHIMLDDLELVGAIEMHLRSSSWYSHGHRDDPNYERVILHVVTHHDNGPDLATLQVPISLGRQTCSARRALTPEELQRLASVRLKRKQEHVLELMRTGHNPFLLGLLETLAFGKGRHQHLQYIARRVGLDHWPGARRWEGSQQARPMPIRLRHIDPLIQRFTQIGNPWERVQNWQDFLCAQTDLIHEGISPAQLQEWSVNFLIPALGFERAMGLWVDLPTFRHYGLEARLMKRGVFSGPITNIASQQAAVAFHQEMCQNLHCASCPLLLSYQCLTAVN